jgi:flagellin-like protein
MPVNLMTRSPNDKGVSVIVGTLLLILITVTAAAGLALMVSQMQKDELNRQSHLAAVAAENITILNVAFENNQTEWNLTGIQNSQNWSSVRLTLVNLNTANTMVMGIAINDHYAVNFTDRSRTDPSVLSRNIYNSTNYLTIPATGSKEVYIDFVANATDDPTGLIDYSQALYFAVNAPQNIKILTSLTNFFQTTLKPPNPIYQISIESENLGVATRDDLVLDGSGSTADNPIVTWNWTIYDGNFTLPTQGNWTDTEDWITHNQTFSGKTSRIMSLNNNDPFYRGSLTVTDSIGMTATSGYFAIPPDSQFNPPVSLNIVTPLPNGIPLIPPPLGNETILTARLTDINNLPVSEAVVALIIDNNPNTPQNCFSISAISNTTQSDGNATFFVLQSNATEPICPQPVTLHAQAGKLLSPTILIPGVP